MKTLKKLAEVVGKVFGVVVGYNFTTTPITHLLGEHRALQFGG